VGCDHIECESEVVDNVREETEFLHVGVEVRGGVIGEEKAAEETESVFEGPLLWVGLVVSI